MNGVTFDFTDAAVLVTGGTSGIGHATARAFALAGASVTVTGTRASVADYDADLSSFAFCQLEMRDAGAIDALAETVDRVDVLVNNAEQTSRMAATSGIRTVSPRPWLSTSKARCGSRRDFGARSRRVR